MEVAIFVELVDFLRLLWFGLGKESYLGKIVITLRAPAIRHSLTMQLCTVL